VDNSKTIFDAAEDVLEILGSQRIEAVVIGAVALAAYSYVRQTQDLDLGVNASTSQLRSLVVLFESKGYCVELREPDGDDPLGGVIDVRGPFGLVQIVSFADRFPAVIDEAVKASTLSVRPGSSLKLVPLPHLIALKLYAGGHKSKSDIVEVLSRNPDLDLDAVRKLCRKYRLRGFDKLLAEAGR
jgi:hypothetical protein